MLACFGLGMVITLCSWASTNPCMPIAQACMQEGYYKGGHQAGKGLVEDCVMPVVAKTKVLTGAAFTDTVLQQCSAKLTQKMQEKMKSLQPAQGTQPAQPTQPGAAPAQTTPQ